MPYKLRKAPRRELYWVVNKDTGQKHSKDPLPKERAKAQMKALYAAEKGYKMRGRGRLPVFEELTRRGTQEATPLNPDAREFLPERPDWVRDSYHFLLQMIRYIQDEWRGDIGDIQRQFRRFVGQMKQHPYTYITRSIPYMRDTSRVPRGRDATTGEEGFVFDYARAFANMIEHVRSNNYPLPTAKSKLKNVLQPLRQAYIFERYIHRRGGRVAPTTPAPQRPRTEWIGQNQALLRAFLDSIQNGEITNNTQLGQALETLRGRMDRNGFYEYVVPLNTTYGGDPMGELARQGTDQLTGQQGWVVPFRLIVGEILGGIRHNRSFDEHIYDSVALAEALLHAYVFQLADTGLENAMAGMDMTGEGKRSLPDWTSSLPEKWKKFLGYS